MNELVDMTHPDLDTTITVAAGSVAVHQQSGWQLVDDDTPEAEPTTSWSTAEEEDTDHTDQED